MAGASLAREIGGAPDPLPLSNAAAVVLLVLAELAAVVAVVTIWRGEGRSLVARLLWTLATLVPAVGLVAFLVWYDPPPPRGPTDRPRGGEWERL